MVENFRQNLIALPHFFVLSHWPLANVLGQVEAGMEGRDHGRVITGLNWYSFP
jgi:hypothetical protein